MSGEPPRRGFFQRMFGSSDPLGREEQGLHPMNATPNANTNNAPLGGANNSGHGMMNKPALPTSVITTNESLLIPPEDKLLLYRALVGIDATPALRSGGNYKRSGQNLGLYNRVLRSEAWAKQRYKFFAILINTCLGIQIVVAAALTALGAASGPHGAVTTFGAINTIMAGILTYLKGSGLPDRMKLYQNEWRNVREYIEQRERELCLAGCQLDVEEEIFTIERMYEGVKREIQATKSGGKSRQSEHQPPQTRRYLQQVGEKSDRADTSKKAEPTSPVSTPEPVLEKH